MKYYTLSLSAEKQVIGVDYPQIIDLPKGYVKDSPRSIYNVPINNFPANPDLDLIPIRKGGKLTDILSCAYISDGFILNKKVKNILQEFRLPENRFFPCSIIYNGKIIEDYYWFYYLSDWTSLIDYSRSEFYVGLNVFMSKGSIILRDYQDYLIKYEELRLEGKAIKARKIYWMEKNSFNLDLFTISKIDLKTYVSEKLKMAFEKNEVTGFELIYPSRNPEIIW